ncbi:KPN_02809 family neutral zinc metallopeptidase [Actinoplanes utahensis]|uniref:Membrane protein n=1 Tax=Actinoplanes utahensis TaxID=1869 RepID=A0A0A6UXF7_ACTUT|nr:neutral zinc metallopeptidase [Actinoplanes utahensis]KHD79119.1 membrane protein [Actinoplanes utahensis]GIF34158.1 membrane protein [Actinoplanes utahensis]
MELNERADIDSSQIEQSRGSGGGGIGGLPIGGGGLAGIVVTLVIALVGGYFGINTMGGGDGQETAGTPVTQCTTGAEQLKVLECRNALYVTSIQNYWRQELPESFGEQYVPAKTNMFKNAVNTACGAADSGVGPFYCPADDKVYIDLAFYEVLAGQLGAPGQFAQPYVLAHEYGHHVQDVLGTEAEMRRRQQRDPGSANEESVKLELQADCYAGAWAHAAANTVDKDGDKIFTSLTETDIQEGIQAAGQIGDDTLQKRGGGEINPEQFTHGTSEQRQHWFRVGYESGDPKQCDTFKAGALG